MRHSLHVILGRQAERHRTHAHAFDVVEMHATHPGAKFFELSFDVPFFHPRDVRRADRGVPRPVGIVTGNAGLENFLAASGGIRGAQAASGQIQSADEEQQSPKRDSIRIEFLKYSHVRSQRIY